LMSEVKLMKVKPIMHQKELKHVPFPISRLIGYRVAYYRFFSIKIAMGFYRF